MLGADWRFLKAIVGLKESKRKIQLAWRGAQFGERSVCFVVWFLMMVVVGTHVALLIVVLVLEIQIQ